MYGVEAALKVIQKECVKHSDCNVCPLRKPMGKGCMIQSVPPDKWVLKNGPLPDYTRDSIFARI